MLEKNSLRGCGGAVPLPKPKKESSSKEEGLETETPFGMNVLSRSLVILDLYFDNKLFGQFEFSDIIGKCCLCACYKATCSIVALSSSAIEAR